MSHPLTIASTICLIAASVVSAADAPRGWRGNGTGDFSDAQPPIEWSRESNVVWKTELPSRSYACPVFVDGKLYLTAEPSHVLCFNAEDGDAAWQSTAGYADVFDEKQVAEITETHRKLEERRRANRDSYKALFTTKPDDKEGLQKLKDEGIAIEAQRHAYSSKFPQEKRGGAGNAAATPISDGQSVYFVFGTGIVASYSLDGRRNWIRHVEGVNSGFGHSSSPVLADGKLIVHLRDIHALDPKTGANLWRTELSPKFGSPIVTRIGDDDVLITPSGSVVKASDGSIIATKLFQLSNNSPIVHGGVVYAHESGKTKAFKLPESLVEPFETSLVWESAGARDQRMASAVYVNGLLFAGGRKGIMDVTDAKTGESVYRKRLDLGELFPSVVRAGDYIFVSGKDGKTLVIKPAREYEVVSVNELERFSSTPIFVGRRMYLRTDKNLYCIGK